MGLFFFHSLTMPPKEKKTKAAIAKAAAAGGSNKKKKKWNSGKVKDKTNNAVYFDEATYEKLLSDVPNSRVITVATVSDKLRINGSLARLAIRDLEAKGKIRKVSTHNSLMLYTSIPKEGKDGKDAE